MARYWWFWLMLLCWPGCRPGMSDREAAEDTDAEFNYDLVVRRPTEPLLKEPGPGADVLTAMPVGTKLKDLAQTSNFTSRREFDGKNYDEPWIKVQTGSGQEGWVYARVAHFQLPAGADTVQWSYAKRLLAYLGPERMDSLDIYRQAYRQIETGADLARVYRQGIRLRDQLVEILEVKTNVSALPDLFWLEEVVPGFIPQLVAEGTAYYLFADYRQWLLPVRRTPEAHDDRFLDLCLYLFPQDSVEYFFPVWKIQTWDYGGHSLLGRGHHLQTLRMMEALRRQTGFFEPDLRDWREALVDDITRLETTYWEQQSTALAELRQIIAENFGCLTREDKIALEIRREQMENANKYGIEFNHQSGLY